MSRGSKAFQVSASLAALGMVLSSTAHAAPSSLTSIDPLVSLSLFGTSSSRAAVCAAGTAAAGAATAAAVAAQPGPGAGCVLPVLGVAPPPPVVSTVPVEPMVATGGFGGLGGLLPLFAILGLGALGVFLLENQDDDGPPPLSPV